MDSIPSLLIVISHAALGAIMVFIIELNYELSAAVPQVWYPRALLMGKKQTQNTQYAYKHPCLSCEAEPFPRMPFLHSSASYNLAVKKYAEGSKCILCRRVSTSGGREAERNYSNSNRYGTFSHRQLRPRLISLALHGH